MKKIHHIFSIIISFGVLLSLIGCSAERYGRMTLPQVNLLLSQQSPYDRQWKSACFAVGRDSFDVEIKGRGHSTYLQPKHPYALRFHTSVSLCGLRPRKHWALLAQFFDHSLIRNSLAMAVARQTSLAETTPNGTFVTLTTNGEWQGVYWLSERVQDMAAEDSLLKLDVYHWADQRTHGAIIDTIPQGMRIDTLSFVDWWLVHELCMNAEPNGPRSCYARITRNGVLKAGPVWDFDMAFNEVGVDNDGDLRPGRFKMMKNLPSFLKGKTIRWLTVDSLYNYSNRMVFNDIMMSPTFINQASLRWRVLYPRFKKITKQFKIYKHQLEAYGNKDQVLWNAKEPARFDSCTTWNSALSSLQNIYRKRLKSLNRFFKEKKYSRN